MQSQTKRGKLLPTKGGFVCCPYCGGKLQKISQRTEATGLPAWCRKCKREILIDIVRGQSFESPRPDDRNDG